MSSQPASRYSPVERLESRSGRVADLLVAGVAVVGLAAAGGRPGVVAGLALLACWLYLRVELTFVVGAVLVAGLGGGVTTAGTAVAATGLAGLLAVDLARTWTSVRPVGAFAAALVVGAAAFALALRVVPLHWVVVGAAAALALGSYGLYRRERRAATPRDDGGER
jgi:hypothetical protein